MCFCYIYLANSFNRMEYKQFRDLNLDDPFFDSLKNDYQEFIVWFNRKGEEGARAYVSYDDANNLQAFLYLKIEDSEVIDVEPALERLKWLKVGTFKIIPHGTKLGERFVKKILDHAIVSRATGIYLTVFPTHEGLVRLLLKYGFEKRAEKNTANGVEDVLVKRLDTIKGNTLLDYPLVNVAAGRKFVLSIWPEFHTQLFPESKLFNETYDLIQDVSHTNSIHKVYICFMQGVQALRSGDLVVIYRTGDGQGSAHYRSVATSICIVEEVHTRASFASMAEFLQYCEAHSVFSRGDLINWYGKDRPLYVIKMTYNIALTKRLIRKVLIEDLGIASDYWGFFEITNEQFANILNLGQVDESIIIN